MNIIHISITVVIMNIGSESDEKLKGCASKELLLWPYPFELLIEGLMFFVAESGVKVVLKKLVKENESEADDDDKVLE